MTALVRLLACLNGTRIGPMARRTGMRVGLVSVGCSAWGQSSDIIFVPCPGGRR